MLLGVWLRASLLEPYSHGSYTIDRVFPGTTVHRLDPFCGGMSRMAAFLPSVCVGPIDALEDALQQTMQ